MGILRSRVAEARAGEATGIGKSVGIAKAATLGAVLVLLLASVTPVVAQVDLSEVGHLTGDPAAPVKVVAFTDFACGACGEFARDTFDELRSTLIDSGRVAWRQIPFMLGFKRGREATMAAECAADQGAFWPMHDALFFDQDRWRTGRRPEEVFEALAADLALDVEQFTRCVDDNAPRRRIEVSNDAAKELGVRATPSFYIDGRPVLGALSADQFTALVVAAEAARAEGGN